MTDTDDERSREEPADRDPTPADGHGFKLRPVHVRAGALIGVLTALLGFAIAVQVRSNSSSDSLSNAREDDLIRILDDQNARAERLNQQIADLQNTLDELQRSGNSDAVAQQQAQRELESLQLLLGTVPATGPGVTVELSDPQHKICWTSSRSCVGPAPSRSSSARSGSPPRRASSTPPTACTSTARP
jgi:uncharacterized protein YlxW (UPF0749 family)